MRAVAVAAVTVLDMAQVVAAQAVAVQAEIIMLMALQEQPIPAAVEEQQVRVLALH
jgi:hypothetical protein